MKFLITRASDGLKPTQPPCEGARKLTNGEFGIKLNSLEELMALAEDIKCPIIIYPVYDSSEDGCKCSSIYVPSDKSPLPAIQIYDDDIE
jgi:hypothetical protein